VIFRVAGEVDLATSPELFMPLIDACCQHRGVVIDLTATDFLDSTAVAVIVRAWRATNSVQPGRVHLVIEPGGQPERILQLCGIPREVPTFASLSVAVSELLTLAELSEVRLSQGIRNAGLGAPAST